MMARFMAIDLKDYFHTMPLPVAVVDSQFLILEATDEFVRLTIEAGRGTEPFVAANCTVAGIDDARRSAAEGLVHEFGVMVGGRPYRAHLVPIREAGLSWLSLTLGCEDESRLSELARSVRSIKHEINNPLTGALGNIGLLLRRNELDEKTRQRLVTAEQEMKKIAQLVGRLADLAASFQKEP
jgi:signal transduction histidine kinase